MIELSIPGRGIVRLEHLVCDVNGTLAVDGRLIEGVSRALSVLRDRLAIHLLTADTFGSQALIDQRLNMTAVRLEPTPITAEAGHEARQKLAYVEQLGAERVVAIGQGANDALMLRAAVIGICVQNSEGTAVETLVSADLVAPNILAALEMLEKPLRLVATLRK
jgi:soluble P-type ATPase